MPGGCQPERLEESNVVSVIAGVQKPRGLKSPKWRKEAIKEVESKQEKIVIAASRKETRKVYKSDLSR